MDYHFTPLTDSKIYNFAVNVIKTDFPGCQIIEIESAKLSFYPGSVFLNCHISDNEGTEHYLHALYCNYQMRIFTGTNAVIYWWNETFGILINEETVCDYVRFFFSEVTGRHGKFHVLQHAMDLPFWSWDDARIEEFFRTNEGIDEEENVDISLFREKIMDMIYPLKIKNVSEAGPIRLEAIILFKDSLFRSDILVERAGLVTMENEALLFENFPMEKTSGAKEMPEKLAEIMDRTKMRAYGEVRSSAQRRISEEIFRTLFIDGLQQNKTHLLYAFTNFIENQGKDDFDVFVKLIHHTRPVIVFESHTPFIEEVICDLIMQKPQNLLVKKKVETVDSQTSLFDIPMIANNDLLVLSLYGSSGIKHESKVCHQITLTEAVVFIGCHSFKSLPATLRDLTDMIIKIPDIGPGNFPAIFYNVFGQEINSQYFQSPTAWTKLISINDIVQAYRLSVNAEKSLQYIEQRVAERSRLVSPDDSPGLENLHGLGEAKEIAIDIINDISDAIQGKISWDKVDKGMLIVGPPGTGKTTLAKAIAKECGVKFINVSATHWHQVDHLGAHLAAITSDFILARRYAPSIMFIDELDTIGARSKTDHNAFYQNIVINTVLQEIQGFNEKEKVIVIGATNNEELIDPAIRRAGRLDKVVNVPFPNKDALEKIYSFYLAKEDRDGSFESDIDFKNLADLSLGLTGADVELIVKGAARRARKGNTVITHKHLIDEITGKPRSENESRRISPDELKRVAVHEAGHALIQLMNKKEDSGVAFVSVVPRSNGTLGFVAKIPSEAALYTRNDYINFLEVMLAGRAAEELYFGKQEVSSGAGGDEESDLAKATHLAATMICKLGLGKSGALVFIHNPDKEHKKEVNKMLRSVYKTTFRKLKSNRGKLESIVNVLIDKQEISGKELTALTGLN